MPIRTEQNALSTSAEMIFAANSGVKYREVKNTDDTIVVYIGPSGVTTSTGHALLPGESFGFEGQAAREAVYAIAASGTPTVTLFEAP